MECNGERYAYETVNDDHAQIDSSARAPRRLDYAVCIDGNVRCDNTVYFLVINGLEEGSPSRLFQELANHHQNDTERFPRSEMHN